ARSEAWFIHQLALRLRAKAASSHDVRDQPLRALDWWYPEHEGEPDMEAVLAEINGWWTEDGGETSGAGAAAREPNGARNRPPHRGAQLSGFHELRDDGS